MLNKVIDFLIAAAVNGIIAIFLALAFYAFLAFILMFAMIPVAVLVGGDGAANSVMSFAGGNISYRVVYAIVFISLMMLMFGTPMSKSAFKKWCAQRRG